MIDRTYQIYGLTVHGDFAIPEWESLARATAAPADVVIRLQPVTLTPSEQAADRVVLARSAADVVFRYVDVGVFRVRAGQEIDLSPSPGVALDRLRPFLLGGVMALLLTQRGWLVLHASAAAIRGQAAAFMGPKGAGKSTIIAQFARQGHSLVSDDITAIDLEQSPPTTVFGSSQIRLWPDTLDHLGIQPDTLPRIHPQFPKRRWTAVDPGPSRAGRIPVGGIYELCTGAETSVEQLAAEAALLALLRHTYLSRWPELFPLFPALLHQLAVMVTRVPVFQLTRACDFDDLPAVCQRIEAAALPEKHGI